jgi:hypothetical protein
MLVFFEGQMHATMILLLYSMTYTGVLIIPWPDQEGNKLQRQKIFIFIYPIYNNNWRNISIIYIYITRIA